MAGHDVREVLRPNRAVRRLKGKSDPIDAYQAARTVMAGQAPVAPNTDGIAAMRALLTTRRSAVKARTAAMNQIHDMLVTAPAELRHRYRPLSGKNLIRALSACRPRSRTGTDHTVLTSLRALAKRHEFLANQITELEDDLRDLVAGPTSH